MQPLHSKTVRIDGVDLLAEATLNNCAGVWTATVRSEQAVVASGAGSSPEAALTSAIERAGAKAQLATGA